MALTVLSRLQTATANAALKVAQACGESLNYTPDGGTTVAVYCIIGKQAYETAQSGGAVGDTRDQLTVTVPRQTGFPPATKLVDDRIVHNSITYRVTKAETDSVEAVYTLTAAAVRG